jgi:hypothetical protein
MRRVMSARNLALFIVLTISHLLATIILLVYVFGAGMARFDTGAPAYWTERAANVALNVLSFPLVSVLLGEGTARHFTGLSGYLPFAVNSTIWASALLTLTLLWRRRRRQP